MAARVSIRTANASLARAHVPDVHLHLALPRRLFDLAVGREWFREVGRPTGAPLLDDVFASLR